MGVVSTATGTEITRARKKSLRCLHPGSRVRAGLAVRVVRGRDLFVPPLVGAASRFAGRACGHGWGFRVKG